MLTRARGGTRQRRGRTSCTVASQASGRAPPAVCANVNGKTRSFISKKNNKKIEKKIKKYCMLMQQRVCISACECMCANVNGEKEKLHK